MFLTVGNIHVIGAKKLPGESSAHLKITNAIVSLWLECFPAFRNGNSDLHFFANLDVFWSGQMILLPTSQQNGGGARMLSMSDTKCNVIDLLHLGQTVCHLEVPPFPSEGKSFLPS